MFPAVVSMAGRSLLLQFKQISRGVPISPINQQLEAYCFYKSFKQFPAEIKCAKIISHGCPQAFCYQFFCSG
jgi:hypothetical protein